MRKRPLFASILCLLALFTGASPAAAALRMFITGDTHNGNFIPFGGPDGYCQASADAAMLGGTFRAWASTSLDDAYCRVAGFSGKLSPGNCGQAQMPNPGPYVRMDGQPFVRNLQELVLSHKIMTPGMVTETGGALVAIPGSPQYAFTGTNFAGVYDGSLFNTCADWTIGTDVSAVTYGVPFLGPFFWTDQNSGGLCDEPHRLYCFEVGANSPMPTYEREGALAFISSAPHDGAYGGLGGADTFCQNLAAAAYLPNSSSFVAWLSTASTHAIDRLSYDGPYKRVDGVQIALDKNDLVDAVTPEDNALAAGLWKTEFDGSNFFYALTGTATNGLADPDTCANWTSNLGTDHAEFGSGTSSLGTWTQGSVSAGSFLGCNAAIYSVYCFSSVPILFWDNFETSPALQRWSAVAP